MQLLAPSSDTAQRIQWAHFAAHHHWVVGLISPT
jgi:hypothetical protein